MSSTSTRTTEYGGAAQARGSRLVTAFAAKHHHIDEPRSKKIPLDIYYHSIARGARVVNRSEMGD